VHFEGTVPIKASREKVWAFLTDPQTASQCAPGLEKLEIVDDSNFTAVVRTGVGPVKGRFTFNVTWLERDAPSRARIQARGKIPSSAVDMEAAMDLTDGDDGTTTMRWQSEVKISGMIASVGARLMQSAAEKITSGIFDCVRQKLESAD
jgi:carbon monoxide dehydrogenase subunit G